MSYEQMKEDSLNINKSESSQETEESFATLLEKSGNFSVRLTPGQKVKSKIVSISGDYVYIDLGGKSEGVMDRNEFLLEDGTFGVHEGDEIEAYFVTVRNGIRILTTLVHGYPASKMHVIRDAHSAGLPVNGEVSRQLKGGFEISVGGVRCFCPYSLIDLKGGREGEVYVGRTFPFQVLEYKDDGRNIVLSRRILLEQELEARIDLLKDRLDLGTEVSARVRSVQTFGAFVDLGGIDALIPSSEVSWDRKDTVMKVLSVGQEVTAKIIALDWENNRVTLSLKAMHPDPWATAAEKYTVDSRVTGTVNRLAPFGAFVHLESGIDGMIHISNLGAGRRVNHPKEVLTPGQLVEVYVLAVDQENRKISLSLQPKVQPKKIVLPAVGELLDGVVEKVMPFGIFLKLSNGLSGLIPNAEIDGPDGADRKRMFPAGTEMQAIVIDVDNAKNKIRLSRKAVKDRETQEEYQQYVESRRKTSGSAGGLGSLGELLKAKIDEKNRQE